MARFLLVDDEEAITVELASILERAGFTVAVARDGEAGLRQVQAFGPDLIVLDVLMPGLSGREVSRRLGYFHPARMAISYEIDQEIPVWGETMSWVQIQP